MDKLQKNIGKKGNFCIVGEIGTAKKKLCLIGEQKKYCTRLVSSLSFLSLASANYLNFIFIFLYLLFTHSSSLHEMLPHNTVKKQKAEQSKMQRKRLVVENVEKE